MQRLSECIFKERNFAFEGSKLEQVVQVSPLSDTQVGEYGMGDGDGRITMRSEYDAFTHFSCRASAAKDILTLMQDSHYNADNVGRASVVAQIEFTGSSYDRVEDTRTRLDELQNALGMEYPSLSDTIYSESDADPLDPLVDPEQWPNASADQNSGFRDPIGTAFKNLLGLVDNLESHCEQIVRNLPTESSSKSFKLDVGDLQRPTDRTLRSLHSRLQAAGIIIPAVSSPLRTEPASSDLWTSAAYLRNLDPTVLTDLRDDAMKESKRWEGRLRDWEQQPSHESTWTLDQATQHDLTNINSVHLDRLDTHLNHLFKIRWLCLTLRQSLYGLDPAFAESVGGSRRHVPAPMFSVSGADQRGLPTSY